MSSEKLPQYQPAQLEGAPGVVQDAPGVQGAPSVQGAPGVQGLPDGPQDVAHVAQNYRDQLFAQCAAGNHERKTEYGMCGIITAVMCFPCGLICLFSDKKETCSRCGISLAK